MGLGGNDNLNLITENLTELLQNTVNMTSVFYDIFLNPEPTLVELKQFASDGTFKVISIPNRAMDRSIALVGSGSPEGVVEANVGTSYVDEENQAVYFKIVGTGNTGWVVVLTQEGVQAYLRNYLAESNFMTEGDTSRYLTVNNYAQKMDITDALDQYKPTIYMNRISETSGVVNLADYSGYQMTITGNTTFSLPVVTDLTKLHKIFLQINKVDANATVNVGTIYFFDKIEPDFSIAGLYNVVYEYDNLGGTWICGVMPKGTLTGGSTTIGTGGWVATGSSGSTLTWRRFFTSEWVQSGNNYTLAVTDCSLGMAVFEGDYTSKKLVSNINLEVTASGVTLTSPRQFDGYLLGMSVASS